MHQPVKGCVLRSAISLEVTSTVFRPLIPGGSFQNWGQGYCRKTWFLRDIACVSEGLPAWADPLLVNMIKTPVFLCGCSQRASPRQERPWSCRGKADFEAPSEFCTGESSGRSAPRACRSLTRHTSSPPPGPLLPANKLETCCKEGILPPLQMSWFKEKSIFVWPV